MLLKNYETRCLLCNLSILGASTQPDTFAFRGDLVLEEGDIADASGRRMPPKSVVKQAAVLEHNGKLSMVVGGLIDLATLPLFVENYRADLAPDIQVLFYVENLGKALIVDLDGVNITLLPHYDGGAIWNTLMGDLKLDKDDFKGYSAEDKLLVIQKALAEYSPKLDSLSFPQALGHIVELRREARGPI
ncbi:hypothetical protein ACYZUD_08855 [Pseudomonas sp. XS1P51]